MEVTAAQAARLLGTTQRTIQRRIKDGTLPARLQGKKREARIELDDLRVFAVKFGYRVEESKLAEPVK